ncbi:MAG TPA: BTAD domain-containing putative transcriptional regulator [Chloroflexaceae bacterium]|nr:BTAD domain-containing putative transcriptional regulator [Chloroflexaceae bacterium]
MLYRGNYSQPRRPGFPRATLTLVLLGDAACQLDASPLRFARRSSLALAVYLAQAGREQSRAVLAALFAGENDELSALTALRNALRDLRAVLGDHVQIDTRTVGLAPALELVTDVARFEAVARKGLECGELLALREAIAAYRGEFAAGLAVKGAPGLDEWLLQERERLRDLYLRVLEQLALADERTNDRASAIVTLRRLVSEEPWREEGHRALMRFLAVDGQQAAALRQFEQCRAALRRELNVEPQPDTVALYKQILAGPVSPPHNLPARATAFIDRPAERALLAEQLQHPGGRLVTLSGIGGAGQTSLAL